MNLIDFFSEHGVAHLLSGHEHCRPGWVQTDCPFCSPNWKHWRLGFNLSTPRRVSCWACGPHNLVECLVKLTNLSWRECARTFNKVEGFYIPEEKQRGRLVIPDEVGELLPAHRRYLKKRGFDPEEIANTWKVGGIGIAARLTWRLFIPIYLGDEMLSWTTRSMNDSHTGRYITASPKEEKVSSRDLLYGEHLASHCIIVVEGPLDAWAIGPGGVATLGTNYSEAQVVRMSRYPVRVICLDNEPHAQKRARQLCDKLECLPGETINVELSTGKDPSRISAKELKRLRSFLR